MECFWYNYTIINCLLTILVHKYNAQPIYYTDVSKCCEYLTNWSIPLTHVRVFLTQARQSTGSPTVQQTNNIWNLFARDKTASKARQWIRGGWPVVVGTTEGSVFRWHFPVATAPTSTARVSSSSGRGAGVGSRRRRTRCTPTRAGRERRPNGAPWRCTTPPSPATERVYIHFSTVLYPGKCPV